MSIRPQNNRMEELRSQISIIPNQSGVYQYFDNKGEVLYVGKAKDLKKRISSYFTGYIDNRKTWLLVKNIVEIRYTIVDSEQDALLLENSLIKKYQPKYNVRLKDDKSYPWICIKNETFPRVFMTRTIIRDGSTYFGPYSSVYTIRVMLDMFKKMYPLRTCNLKLNSRDIKAGKFSVCLEYHIKNCCAPCENHCTEGEYNEFINQIKTILSGKISSVVRLLKENMKELSEEMKYEEAHAVKQKLQALEKYQSKSTVVNSSTGDIDTFSIISDEEVAYIQYLRILNGSIVNTFTLELKKVLEETDEDLLLMAIIEIRQKFNSYTKEVLVPFEINKKIENIRFNTPKTGEKTKLLELAKRNLIYYRRERLQSEQLKENSKNKNNAILEKLKIDLHLRELPVHIECFDNSNTQGTNPVAACVVFKNGKPAKKDYRYFNIKTVEGSDDFASMEEIVYRRYKRLKTENQDMPQLIVIDGGKGQLKSALVALEKLELRGKIPIIGIAKKLEEIYFPNDSIPVYLDKRSSSLRLIQQLRDEAHRFGITFHRNQRSKNFAKTDLLNIKGVGKETALKLLKHFKSIENLRKVPFSTIEQQIGNHRASLVISWLSEDYDNTD